MNPITIHPKVRSNSVESNSILPVQTQVASPIPEEQVPSLADQVKQGVKLQCWMNLVRSGGVIPDLTSGRNQIHQRLLEDLLIPSKNSQNVVEKLGEYCLGQKQQETEGLSKEDITEFDI